MGQKVNPLGIRLGITRDWTSRWYAGKKQFPVHVYTDFRVRKFLTTKLHEASVSRIQIERAAKKVNITIQTARPGIVIGKKGEDIEKLRQETAKLLGMAVADVRINIAEIRKPELDSQLVADSIAQQIEKRVMFRRAMKRAVMSTMRSGALGVKVRVSGRLNGSEIARTEWYREGRIPLHTFRADIDYGLSEAHTTYGIIGVKVWIFKGEVFDKVELAQPVAEGEGRGHDDHDGGRACRWRRQGELAVALRLFHRRNPRRALFVAGRTFAGHQGRAGPHHVDDDGNLAGLQFHRWLSRRLYRQLLEPDGEAGILSHGRRHRRSRQRDHLRLPMAVKWCVEGLNLY